MRSLIRRLVLLTLSVLAVMALVAPGSAHAAGYRYGSRRFTPVRCGYYQPVYVIPTSTGNITVLRDSCGYERRRFDPFRSYYDDDYYGGYNNAPRYTVIFNNF